LLHAVDSLGQNLVPNHSLEVITECPFELGQPGPIEAPPWVAIGSADYFHACADPMYAGVPTNFQGFQPAQNGFAYGGFYLTLDPGSNYREYLMTELIDTLVQDQCYSLDQQCK
jgi:hypothetical protein